MRNNIGMDYAFGSLTGTGAAIDENIGFRPRRVKLFKLDGNVNAMWDSSMASGSAIKDKDFWPTCLTKPPVLSMGSTKSAIATSAFNFVVAGVNYTKAAVAAGTAITATTVPQNKYGLFGHEVGSDGTLHSRDAAGNATGYDSVALAIAAAPAASDANHMIIGYVVVINTAAAFVGATTLFDATGVTPLWYSALSGLYVASNGITPLDDGTTLGFRLGTDSDLNVAGYPVFYEAWR